MADGDAAFEWHACELGAGELAAPIRVEDFRLAVFRQSFLQRLDAEIGLHADRYPMAENPEAGPIGYAGEIDKDVRHKDVRAIPSLKLRLADILSGLATGADCAGDTIKPVPRRRLRGVRLTIDCNYPALHQRRDVQATNHDAFEGKPIAAHAAAHAFRQAQEDNSDAIRRSGASSQDRPPVRAGAGNRRCRD